jgi:DNA-binding response OmpR family regulator
VNPLADDRLDVLFVCEDADLAEMYRMKLELDGYLVRTVRRDEDWPQGSWRPDIAYLDVDTGEGIGVRGLARLRSEAATHDVPAVILSRLSAPQLAERGFVPGPQDYLVTISEPFQLTPAIDRLSQGLPVPASARE